MVGALQLRFIFVHVLVVGEEHQQRRKDIYHNIVQEGSERPIFVGLSEINTEGVLSNALEVPENLKQKQISKAIHSFLKDENFTRIESIFCLLLTIIKRL